MLGNISTGFSHLNYLLTFPKPGDNLIWVVEAKRFYHLPNLDKLANLDCFTFEKGNEAPRFTQFYEKGGAGFKGNAIKVGNPIDPTQFRLPIDQWEIEKRPENTLLSESINRRMEPFILTLRKGIAIDGHFYQHKDNEFFISSKEKLKLKLKMKKCY